MRHRHRFAMTMALVIVVSGLAGVRGVSGRGDESASTGVGSIPREMNMDGDRVRAPELEGGLDWLNTDKPIRLADLRGKVVVLDFWTYCCINCMHVIPDLKKLEEKYKDALVVIGVHSAKFTNERESANIRQAILRYEIAHPVVNDADFKIWRAYGAAGWPTLVLIDPEGSLVGGVSGEGNYALLDRAIGQLVAAARDQGRLEPGALDFVLERVRTAPRLLAFPGKVLAAGTRLFIADSNHNRIVIAKPDGTVESVAGSGMTGRRDGPFASATFDHPQGMALVGDALFVADTENHLIRRLDLQAKTVRTAAGTGAQSTPGTAAGPALAVPLGSPWDLVAVGTTLYVAMAGPHQIWALDLDRGQIAPFAGSGREGRIDGPRPSAALAQPSGLATDGSRLYVADSEVSAIRAIDLGPEGVVHTLAGLDLFEFGDRDGSAEEVRLQHPLGVAYREGRLYVADTYNHKVKILDLEARRVMTLAGTGRPGADDGTPGAFYEPGGLSVAGDALYVADTNNHMIRQVNLATGAVSSLVLRASEAPGARRTAALELPEQPLQAGRAEVVLRFALPAGYEINRDAPSRLTVTSEGAAVSVDDTAARQVLAPKSRELRAPLTVAAAGAVGMLRIDAAIYYCREGKAALCHLATPAWSVPVRSSSAGPTTLTIDYRVTPPA